MPPNGKPAPKSPGFVLEKWAMAWGHVRMALPENVVYPQNLLMNQC